MTKLSRRGPSRWFARYGRATFLSWDFLFAAAMAVGAAVLFAVSEQARGAGDGLAAAAAGICAGLLGLVLAAMTVVIAFVNRTFVLLIGDLREALMPFATVAAAAAGGLLVGLVGVVALEPLAWQATVALLTALTLLTAWTVAGVVSLVFLSIYFARVREAELTAIEQAEEARRARIESRG